MEFMFGRPLSPEELEMIGLMHCSKRPLGSITKSAATSM
jgi:hypothetical protein